MPRKWYFVIRRWNRETLLYEPEETETFSPISYDAKDGEMITGVGFYEALNKVEIFVREIYSVDIPKTSQNSKS